MKLFSIFNSLSRGRQIAVAVCSLHVLLVLALLCHHLISGRLKPPRPMVVKTIAAVQPTQVVYGEPPRKRVSEKKIKKEAPPQKVAAPKAKPVPVAKKAAPPKEKAVYTEGIETLSAETKQTRPSLLLPSKIEVKKESAPPLNLEPTYQEYLIAYLQSVLDLPEYGDVRAKVEIDRFGRLIDCEILEAKSRKNGEFLKNQLPALTFPCLNDFGISDATETFTITFRNVEVH